ncbi:hypothetical protein LTR62_008039 [Meristemomyces frigidus]|uniref:Uncharacterized protein n=1 Tax=Meristemomyces frigidus TaxID=1508187 RepID=A0AAN7TPK1_9PEZI|nr:hypothetical protein LTR62_008039 [Meristemomyces frigidus]
MAATTAFPSVSLPVPEDSMDIGSPAAQSLHYDSDIDFDDAPHDGGALIPDDEQMLTDGEHTRPMTATDEIMDDDLQFIDTQEAEMHDTPGIDQPQEQQYIPEDEELIDYGDEEYPQDDTEDTTLVTLDDGFNTYPEQAEEVDEEIVRQPKDFASGTIDIVNDPAQGVEDPVDVNGNDGFAATQEHHFDTSQPHDDQVADEDKTQIEIPEDGFATPNDYLYEGEEVTAEGVDPAAQPDLTVDTTNLAEFDQPPTPTDTGLHPMTVNYSGIVMPLFKSKRQPEGLLKDDNLASLSLHELLTKCRERLTIKLGTLPEDQELTLAFDHLRLVLVEVSNSRNTRNATPLTLLQNSRAAFEHSLNDVLEVYLQLHTNDGIHECPPLTMSLAHQQFSSQLALFQQAAGAGTGISHFMAREEEQQEYKEDGEQYSGDEVAYPGDGAVHADLEYPGHEKEYQQHQRPEEAHNAPESNEEYEQEAYDDHQYEEVVAQEERGEREPHEEVIAVGEHHAGPSRHTNQDGNGARAEIDAQSHNAVEGTLLHRDGQPDQEQPVGEGEDVDAFDMSLASSRTLQGDHNTVEDGIDWDEEPDLPGNLLALSTDEIDDVSTLVANPGTDEAAKTTVPHANELESQPALPDEQPRNHGAPVNESGRYLGHKDFLGAEAVHQDNEEGNAQLQDVQEKVFDQDDEDQDQADTNDEQQDSLYKRAGEEEQHRPHVDGAANDEISEHGPEPQAKEMDDKDQIEDLYDGEAEVGDVIPQPAKPQEDPEDVLEFDDDTPQQHEARKASNAGPKVAANDKSSPSAKRSFDEALEDLIFDDFEEPEAKKARV